MLEGQDWPMHSMPSASPAGEGGGGGRGGWDWGKVCRLHAACNACQGTGMQAFRPGRRTMPQQTTQTTPLARAAMCGAAARTLQHVVLVVHQHGLHTEEGQGGCTGRARGKSWHRSAEPPAGTAVLPLEAPIPNPAAQPAWCSTVQQPAVCESCCQSDSPEPGFSGQAAGSGVIMWPAVSVCHQVSTMGQRPSPTTCRELRNGGEQRWNRGQVPPGQQAAPELGAVGPGLHCKPPSQPGWQSVNQINT